MNLFFGRKRELRKLAADFFVREPGEGYCAAVTGPNDIGKTMLVAEAARRFEAEPHPNVYYFKKSMMGVSGYWPFWAGLIRDFSLRMPEEALENAPNPDPDWICEILAAYEFFTSREELDRMGTPGFHSDATQYLTILFEAFTEIGIHILISIDEFDLARTAFPEDAGDGAFFQRLFLLSHKSADYKLSILLISRRRISTIAHHMADGSDIESAFPPAIVLRGFADEEMEEYFASYADLPCGIPDEAVREQICYFAGRHPGQLMKMRELFADNAGEGEMPTPAVLYREYGTAMTRAFERMNTLLRTEFIDSARRRSCVNTFAQLFVGPAYDADLPMHLEQMHGYGLLTRRDRFGRSVFQLAGIPEDADGRPFEYEPMSPYFVEFFRLRVLPEEMDDLGRLMTEGELDVRKGILDVLKHECAGHWREEIDSYLSGTKEIFRDRLELTAAQNDADARNITWTSLDVMAFTDYAKIIRHRWAAMKKYFRSWTDAESLRQDFRVLAEGRNCFAHNNSQILDAAHCEQLRLLCRRLIEDYQLGAAGVPV